MSSMASRRRSTATQPTAPSPKRRSLMFCSRPGETSEWACMCSVPAVSSATQKATNGALMISPAACAMEVSTWPVSSDEVTR